MYFTMHYSSQEERKVEEGEKIKHEEKKKKSKTPLFGPG